MFQSTHPHGVRRNRNDDGSLQHSVSIHAPARGATGRNLTTMKNTYVSIHAPARGATEPLLYPPRSFMFQSTHPHGVRPPVTTPKPTSRAFQSTHPHGVRLGLALLLAGCDKFQSTHPHGVRHVANALNAGGKSFNPRTRTGCDMAFLDTKVSSSPVSIHAPARGATYVLSHPLAVSQFQSTHPHGVRLSSLVLTSDINLCFNPRTRTGCDFVLACF